MQHQACARAHWWAAQSICTQVQLDMALNKIWRPVYPKDQECFTLVASVKVSLKHAGQHSALGDCCGERRRAWGLVALFCGVCVSLLLQGDLQRIALEVEHGCALKGPYQTVSLRGVVRMIGPGIYLAQVQPCLVTCPAVTAGWLLPLPSLNPGVPDVTAACPPAGCTHLSAPGDDPAL